MATLTTATTASLLSAALVKQNGGPGDTAPHPLSQSLGALTTIPTETLLAARLDFAARLAETDVLDMHWRMLTIGEVRRGMGVEDEFKSWGSKRAQVAGFGNMVPPPLGQWIAERVKMIL